jgi:hypothetical protein
MGIITSVLAVATGEFLANKLGLLNGEWILRGEWSDLRIHQYFGGATVFFGFLCIRSSYARRKEHQGLSKYTLATGLAWAVAAGGAGYYGFKLSRTHRTGIVLANQVQSETPRRDEHEVGVDAPVSGRSARLMRILNYPSLVSMHPEPVRSRFHKNRWIRVWVSQNAAEAYTQGNQLPEGALVVMSSTEDRWGRMTHELGPLYSLEILQGGEPRLGLYWPNVPESKRDEVGGLANVSWVSPNPNLASCLECHENGMASPRNRSRVRVVAPPRRPDSETESQGGSQQQPQQTQSQQ